MPVVKPLTKGARDARSALETVIDAISTREGARLPEQDQFDRAVAILAERPGDNVARWVSPVSLYHVREHNKEHTVVVMDRGDDPNPAETAECSCRLFRERHEPCAHVLAVLAVHPGKLT